MITAVVGWSTITGLALQRGFEPFDVISSRLWLAILGIEMYCRTPLTGQINDLSDQLKEQEQKGIQIKSVRQRWDRLHRLSVQPNSAVLVMGLCLIGLV